MADSKLENLTPVVEAIIFASDEPVPLDQLKNIIEDASGKEIRNAVDALNHSYSQTDRTFHIIEVAGGFQMVTRDAYANWLQRLFSRKAKSRLSQAALETLSVIAFKQPISKTDVSNIRGVNCDGVVKTLLERDLVAIGGRADGPGRPLLYKTTKEFLRYFGINSIKDLPKPREIEELLADDKPTDADEETLPLYPLDSNARFGDGLSDGSAEDGDVERGEPVEAEGDGEEESELSSELEDAGSSHGSEVTESADDEGDAASADESDATEEPLSESEGHEESSSELAQGDDGEDVQEAAEAAGEADDPNREEATDAADERGSET